MDEAGSCYVKSCSTEQSSLLIVSICILGLCHASPRCDDFALPAKNAAHRYLLSTRLSMPVCRLSLVKVEPVDSSVLGSDPGLGKQLTSLPPVPLSLGLNMHLPGRTG